jgi:nifR3 family TIM-barrel protein
MKTIWHRLKKPFFALAPMENVTDTVFRRIVARCGRPDVFFTEFTSTDGLCSEGYERVRKHLEFTEEERPIIAQIWGTRPEKFLQAAKMVADMGFDGIDINMGCPVRKVVSRGSCSGLIRTPALAKEIILATKEGAGDLPVSVKTRIGYREIMTEEWIGFLLEQQIAALTIHGRTVREMSKAPAHWEEIGRAVILRNQMKKDILIIGNGDVVSLQDGMDKYERYKVDGIMIGRGIFNNLWIFRDVDPETIGLEERMRFLIDHISLFDEVWGKDRPFDVMKKFFKVYVTGFPNANAVRLEMMQLRSAGEAISYIKENIKLLKLTI